jgi:hypothetical protein
MDTRMCRQVTTGWIRCGGGLLLAALAGWAQPAGAPEGFRPDWRRIGTAAVDMSLASVAGGPVDRVWYSADGATVFARLPSGKTFETNDFDSWKEASASVQPTNPPEVFAAFKPESGAVVRSQPGSAIRLYAAGRNAYRSDDGGQNWRNLTVWRRESIIGDGTRDLAVSPRDPDEVVVANSFGIWRSVDGGATWSGLNDTLPNLPVRRLLALPRGIQGARLLLDNAGALTEAEWVPGEKTAWKPQPDAALDSEAARRRALSQRFGAPVTALAAAGRYVYAGSSDGRLWVSAVTPCAGALGRSPLRSSQNSPPFMVRSTRAPSRAASAANARRGSASSTQMDSTATPVPGHGSSHPTPSSAETHNRPSEEPA